MAGVERDQDVLQQPIGDVVTEDIASKYQGRFVKPRDREDQSTSEFTTVTGDQAKSFYESIINTKSSKKNHSKKKRRHQHCARTTKTSLVTSSLTIEEIKKYVAKLFCLCAEKNKKSKELKNHLRDLFTNDEFRKIINSSDQYGWTALMSASAANNLDAVKILINYGAKFHGVTDKAGNSIQEICKRNRAVDVLNYLLSLEVDSKTMVTRQCGNQQNESGSARMVEDYQPSASGTDHQRFDKSSTTHHSSDGRCNVLPSYRLPASESLTASPSNRRCSTSTSRSGAYNSTEDCTGSLSTSTSIEVECPNINDEKTHCELCDVSFLASSKKKHQTSLSHLLKDTSKILPDNCYTIPEHNVGFQMMLRTGWEQEGLGPDGSGRKRPIKTALKLDKGGLGLTKTKERVSHFAAFEEKAIGKRTHDEIVNKERKKRKSKSDTGSVKWRQERDKKSRYWERDLRRYMSSNDS